jgi:hypothetical protein
MSVLSNCTKLSMVNNTDHFLSITLEAEQNGNFSVATDSKNVVPCITRSTNQSFLEYLWRAVTGASSNHVIVNLDKRTNALMKIRSTVGLNFEFSTKIVGSSEQMPGDFTLGVSDQSGNIIVEFVEEKGMAYDSNGNVFILGRGRPIISELMVHARLRHENGHAFSVINFSPAMCKLKIV